MSVSPFCRFSKNLIVIDEFLPAIIASTDYSDVSEVRDATRAAFSDIPRLNALAFKVSSEVSSLIDYCQETVGCCFCVRLF
jgi:hypothetical protein